MPEPHVAVIAVHGVADQVPSESARQIAALLQQHTPVAHYDAFEEKHLRISTEPVLHREAEARTADTASPLDESSRYVQSRLDGSTKIDSTTGIQSPDHQFMRAQIAEYESPREPYETLRLEGTRTHDGKRGGVHVYEMYWADLSRVGAGFFHILGDLYQLIFHLPHLGRLALELASFEQIEAPAGAFWRWGIKLHRGAQRMLTLVLPLLALITLGTLLTLLLPALPQFARTVIAAGFVALGVTLLLGFVAFRYWPHRLGVLSGVLPLVALSTVGTVAYQYLSGIDDASSAVLDKILATSWLAIALVLYLWILGMLERYRPGARRWGTGLGLIFFVPLVVLVMASSSRGDLISGIIWIAETELLVSAAPFFLFSLTSVLAALSTYLATRTLSDEAMRQRFRNAAWTARATFAFAVTFYALASVSIASALFIAARGMLPNETHVPLVSLLTGKGASDPVPLRDFVGTLISEAAGDGFPILVAGFLGFVVVLMWSLTPLILHEIRSDNAQRAREGNRSERLGHWLDSALFTVPAAINLLFFLAVFLAPALFSYSFVSVLFFDPDHEGLGVTPDLIIWLGSTIAASAVGLLALKSRLAPLVGSLRSGLDRALDVDNYLREHPRSFTPRARIAERYTSLLRYLTAWRSPEGEPYRAIVIVAHSQGTPITADLLRFLRRETPAELTDLMTAHPSERHTRLYLVTMGSPLAQVYGRAFPHLYHWMNGEPSAWSEPPEDEATVELSPPAAPEDTTDDATGDAKPTPPVDTSGHVVTPPTGLRPRTGSSAPGSRPLGQHLPQRRLRRASVLAPAPKLPLPLPSLRFPGSHLLRFRRRRPPAS